MVLSLSTLQCLLRWPNAGQNVYKFKRFTDAHHIQHWADGGETRLDSLVLLCRHHHRLVHEGGFGLRPTHDGLLIFTRLDGRRIDAVPAQPSASETVARYNRDRGLEMDADMGRCLWQGETMDYDMAVAGLLSAAVSATENLWERQSSRPLHK